MALAVIASNALVPVYLSSAEEGEELPVSETLVIGAILGASFGWLASFVLYFLLMKKEYRRTFWSTRTGKANTMAHFNRDTDKGKSVVVECNEMQWLEIHEKVQAWVAENWEKWLDTEPAWFTEAWRDKVPQEWLDVLMTDNELRSSATSAIEHRIEVSAMEERLRGVVGGGARSSFRGSLKGILGRRGSGARGGEAGRGGRGRDRRSGRERSVRGSAKKLINVLERRASGGGGQQLAAIVPVAN